MASPLDFLMSRTTDNAYERAEMCGAPPVVVHTPDATSYRAEYDLGDVVYLRVRNEAIKGLVTGLIVRPGGVVYLVVWGQDGRENAHYAMELHDQPEF